MNYLAHLYLSGNDEELMFGNFIGDHVKGSDFMGYNKRVSEGILMHRFIDTFTDAHSKFEESKLRLRPTFRKYAPVIVDMYYDHFLAANFEKYSEKSLEEFAQQSYQIIGRYFEQMPDSSKRTFHVMQMQDWLLSYKDLDGLNRALSNMAKRTSFISGMEKASEFLEKHYSAFESEFFDFFEDVQEVCEWKINEINQRLA